MWLGRRGVLAMGGSLALAVLVLAASFLWHERRDLQSNELQYTQMLTRLLEDHVNRTFNTVDVTLAAVAETVPTLEGASDARKLSALLLQAQQGLPALRSLSLMNRQGRVLASSVADNLGAVVSPDQVPLPPAGAADRLGGLVMGRDLYDAKTGHQTSPRSFIPLVRAVHDHAGNNAFLVAVLNPDYFANEHQLILADDSRSAALLTMQGRLLSATENIDLPPGQSVAAHPFFRDELPTRERGSLIGLGIDQRPAVAAFRTLRQRPVVVVVQRDHAQVTAALTALANWVGMACAVALALIAAMAAGAWRSLRSHEGMQHVLETTREQALVSERNLRVMVESVQELIFRTDADGRISFVNERWRPFFGRPTSDALGRHLANFCQPADRDRVARLFQPDHHPDLHAVLVQISLPGGGARALELSVAPVRGDDQTLLGFAGCAMDVTDRQIARNKLEWQLQFTARLLEVNPTPMFVKDAQGRYVMVNAAWLAMVGLTKQQVIGQTPESLYSQHTQMPAQQADLHRQHDQRLLQSDEAVRYEHQINLPGQAPRDTVITKVRLVYADGTLAGIVGSMMDVTEFREAERSIRRGKEAAERANRLQSEFIAHISHELRTPLQAIIGFSDLGAEFAADQADVKEMFDDIHGGGQRMLALVNDLLDLAKAEAEAATMDLQPRDLAELVSEVVRELRPLAQPRRLSIAWTTPPPALPTRVDNLRLQQVVRNVLANAMRYAPDSSTIELQGRLLGDQAVEVTLRDHGLGIPAQELDSIFEAFVQSSATAGEAGGTGLGLTICRRIMGAHGGSITADNAPGGGALFRLVLPASPPAMRPAPATQVAALA